MSEPRRSLLDSTRTLLDTALGILQTRAELLATEIEEEWVRYLSAVAYGAVAFVLLSLGLVFLALTLTVLFWEEHRLLVLGALTFFFLATGAGALFFLFRNAKRRGPLFGASIAELKKDRAALRDE